MEEILPWHHSDPEPDKGAYTQAGDRTDDYLDDASERKTNARMYGGHSSHGTPEVNQEDEVRRIGERR